MIMSSSAESRAARARTRRFSIRSCNRLCSMATSPQCFHYRRMVAAPQSGQHPMPHTLFPTVISRPLQRKQYPRQQMSVGHTLAGSDPGATFPLQHRPVLPHLHRRTELWTLVISPSARRSVTVLSPSSRSSSIFILSIGLSGLSVMSITDSTSPTSPPAEVPLPISESPSQSVSPHPRSAWPDP